MENILLSGFASDAGVTQIIFRNREDRALDALKIHFPCCFASQILTLTWLA